MYTLNVVNCSFEHLSSDIRWQFSAKLAVYEDRSLYTANVRFILSFTSRWPKKFTIFLFLQQLWWYICIWSLATLACTNVNTALIIIFSYLYAFWHCSFIIHHVIHRSTSWVSHHTAECNADSDDPSALKVASSHSLIPMFTEDKLPWCNSSNGIKTDCTQLYIAV